MVRRIGSGGDNSSKPTATATSVANSVQPQVVEANAVPATTTTSKALVTRDDMPFSLSEVGQVGGEAQNQIAAVSSKIADTAKTSDMDEVGKLLQDTLMTAKGYDPKNLFKGGLFGFFKAKTAQIQMKFDTVDKSVNRLVEQIDDRIAKFRGRVTDLDQMAEAGRNYHDSLTGQIEYLNERADWMEQNQPTVDANDPMSAQFVQDWITVTNFARKRADDLRRAQLLTQQQGAQIQQMKTNSIALAQKFGDIKVTTIPALKNTFALYIINLEQKKGAEFSDEIDGMTNQAIQDTAKLLGENTTAIHTSLTRSNVSLESLQANHDSIVNSLEEVKRINAEMKKRLADEAPKLEQLSEDLTARLSQTS